MITLEPPSSPSAADQARTLSRTGLQVYLKRAQAAVGVIGAVEVLLTSDDTIKRLNRQFRGKNKATDVLSFPADSIPGLPSEAQMAGDLAVSLDSASRQAAEHGHSLRDEVRILLLHGLLHLSGMDHETDSGEMGEREAELRTRLRLPSSLIARTVESTMPRSQKPVSTARHTGKSVAKAAAKNPGTSTARQRRDTAEPTVRRTARGEPR
jgi:probable rRNA maturation factor